MPAVERVVLVTPTTVRHTLAVVVAVLPMLVALLAVVVLVVLVVTA